MTPETVEATKTVAVDLGENATRLLEQLAAKLGVTTEYFWPILVKQQVIQGWMAVVLCSLCLIIVLFATYKLSTRWRIWCKDMEDEDVTGWKFPVSILSILGFGVCLISQIGQIIKIFNPEYYALQALLSMIR